MRYLPEVLCFVYYLTASIQTIPCIWRIWKRKSSSDYSLVSEVFSIVGNTAWTVYIFMTDQSVMVYIGTIFDAVVLIVYEFMVFRFHKTG